MPFFEKSGAKIYYEESGERKEFNSIVLLNGYMRPMGDFRQLIRYLVENKYHVLTIDHRGAGQSESEIDFTMQDLAVDVIDVTKSISLKDFSLLGISMGGMVAQLVAATLGSEISKLYLISTSSDVRKTPLLELNLAWGQEDLTLHLMRYVSSDFAKKNMALIVAMAKQMLKSANEGTHYKINAKRQRTASSQFCAVGLLHLIKSKTTILHGEEDAIIVCDAANKLHEGIPNSELILIPKVGHLILIEAPQRLKDLL
ncbi:MAG: alpha/beta hydrolase [Oligoflexales bacterium]|nr:alpha/beta hydrolase [Oligoflexales bacterium]